MRNPILVAWRSYMRLLNQRPLIAQTGSTMVLMAAGDAISQKLIERRPKFDFNRNKNFWIVGGCFLGPVLSKWMFFINRYFVGTPKAKALKMVLADQLVLTPPLIFAIVSLLNVLKGTSTEQWMAHMKANYPEILWNNYKLWPAAQWINFNFVPLPFRVLYINSIALFWNVYIAYATQRAPVVLPVADVE